MGLEAAELARWTRFAAKGGIGKGTALCDCVAESPDDLMFLKDDEITVLYQIPDQDGVFLGYCEGVVGRFNGGDVQIHGRLKKPVMAKRSSVSASSTIAKSPSPSNMAKMSASSPSPAPSPRPPSVSTRRSSAASRRDSDGAGISVGGGGMGSMERRGSTTGLGARRLMSPLSSAVLNLDDEDQYRPTTANLPHMSRSSTSTVADSVGINTPAHTYFPSSQNEKQSPKEFHFPRPPQQPPLFSPSPSSSSRPTSPPTFSVSHSENMPHSPIHRYNSTSSSQPIPSTLNLLPDNYSSDTVSGTSPLRISKKSPTSPTVPSMQAQILSPPQPHASLPNSSPSFAPTLNSNIPENSISSTSSSPSFLTEEHGDRLGLENDIGAGGEGDDAHGIGLSLLRGLSGGLDSDEDDDDDDGWSRSSAGQPLREAGHGGVHQEDDEAYAEALSRVGRRDSLDESTVEGLGYARSEDSHHYPQHQQATLVSNVPNQHLSPTQSPTSPGFPPQQPHRQSQHSQHSQYSQNQNQQQHQQPRERRPSMTPSATSNGSGSGSQAGTIGEWEGYSDIYDDYRYSRYSLASKLSFGLGSSRASVGPGSSLGQEGTYPPPVPDASSRPSVDGFRPSLDGSVRQRVGSGTDRDRERVERGSIRSRTDSLNQNANQHQGKASSAAEGQGPVRGQDQDQATQPAPAFSRRSIFKDRTMSTDSDASVYTQNSRLSTLSQDAVALMSNNILASSGLSLEPTDADVNHLGSIDVDEHTATSTTKRVPSVSNSSYHNQRPAPLNLIQSNTRERGPEHQQNQSTTQPQPLLNTTWGSPLSSPGMDSPKSSSVLYTPLPGIVAQGNARDSVVGLGALATGTEGLRGMQAAVVSPTFGGGFASAMRQRLEEEDRDRREEGAPNSHSNSDGAGDTTTSTIVSGAGLGNRIVVEDEEELPSRAMMADGSMFDTTQDISSSSVFLESSTSTPNSMSTPNSASPDRDLLIGQHLGPLAVAKRAPSPSILEGTSNEGALFVSSKEGPDASEAESRGAEREAEEGGEGRMSPSPLPPSHLRPSLAQLREGAGELVPGTNQRRSLFLPHPNAPKSPPAGVATNGPMFIAAQQGSLPPHQHPPPHPMNMQQHLQSFNLQPGQVLPPQFNQQQRPPRPHLFGVIRQALSMPPRPPAPPSGPPGPNGIRAPVLPRGPTIYGRTEGDLASANGPIPMIWSVDPPPATAPPHANVKVSAGVKGVPAGMASPPRVQMMANRPPRSMSLGPGSAGVSPSGNAGVGAGGGGSVAGSPVSVPSVIEGSGKTSSSGGTSEVAKNSGEEQPPASSGVIPRANFTPKAPGLRPRSRSFSGFNSASSEVSIPLQRSREDGETISSRDVKRSLTTASLTVPSSSSIPSPSSTKPILGSSPLRPSPLSLNASSRSSENLSVNLPLGSPLMKPPSSPLATQSVVLSLPPTSRTTPSSPTIASAPSSPAFSSFNTKQLRQSASRSTLGDPSPSSLNWLGPGAVSRSNTGDGDVSGAQANLPSRVASLQLPPLRHEARNFDNNDAISIHSTRSQVVSQTPGQSVVRQTSLRSKLSLPNLRRKQARGVDDDLTPSSPIAPHGMNVDPHYAEMLQVQDMEFELVRPNLSHFNSHNFNGAARASEDSGVLGREHSVSLDGGGSGSGGSGGGFLRAESPAMSISSSGVGNGRFSEQRSPIGELGTGSNWPPASSSRPTTDNESLSASSSMDAHRQRELKWMGLMQTNPASQARKSKKVRKLVVDGVPSSVRYLVWSHLTDGKARCVPGVYGQLGKRGKVASSAEIERDIRVLFDDDKERTGHLQGTQGPVLGLLQAYLSMVPDVVYSKGLTLIVGQLLLLSPEEDAFWIFVSIMDTHIRPYFASSTTQMEVDSALFSRALEVNDPVIAKKLFVDMGILPSTICQPWFSTLFVNVLPPEYVNRVWDLFLYEGVPFLIRVGLAVITCCKRDVLLSTSETSILTLLSHPPQSFLPSSPDAFLALAFGVKLKDDDVKKQRVKMEAQVKRQTQHSQAPPRASSGLISLPRSS